MIAIQRWKIVGDNSVCRSATEVVLNIAECLRDPAMVNLLTIRSAAQVSHSISQKLLSSHICQNYAAAALLFGQLDRCFPDQQWDQVAHQHLVAAMEFLNEGHEHDMSLGMFGGIAGLCFTTSFLAKGGMHYKRLQSTLDDLLFESVMSATLGANLPQKGVRFVDYDVISGLAGIGAYLLLRDRAISGAAVTKILEHLQFLGTYEGGQLRYFMPPESQPTEMHLRRNPCGATDCGLAHGVPGPLSFLALARYQGFGTPETDKTLRRLSAWTLAQRFDDDWGMTWPASVPPDGKTGGFAWSRAGWCYGSPGVASALWLAGSVLSDCEIQSLALSALHAVYNRPPGARGLTSPILCHGTAGLLQIVLRFLNRSEEEFLQKLASELTQQLLDSYDPTSTVGFHDIDSSGSHVDNPGLLEGAAGIALTLLAAANATEPAWDRMLLLS